MSETDHPKKVDLRSQDIAAEQREKLRNSEADNIRCGRRHFEALAVDFEVVTGASEI